MFFGTSEQVGPFPLQLESDMAVSEPLGEWDPPPRRGGLFSFGGSIQQSSGLLHREERRPPSRPWGAANGAAGPGFCSVRGEKVAKDE